MSRQPRREFVLRVASALAAGFALEGIRGSPILGPTIANAAVIERPIPTRIADIVHSAGDFRSGLFDGVRRPGLGGGDGLQPERARANFTSAVIRAPFASSHVGLHWLADGPSANFELSWSRDGLRWSAWRRIEPTDDGRDQPTDERFGALVGTRGAEWLRYRASFPVMGSIVDRVTLTCLDARAGAGPVAWVAAGPSTFLDRVVTREQWGADESIRFKDGVDQWPRAHVTPSVLFVHHTATDNQYDDPAAEVRAIYTYHTITRGFGDVGYHMLVDNRGQVYEGRRGRDGDVLAANIVGGHVLRYNYGSAGIAVLGNFEQATPGAATLDALVDALAFECARHGIDPLGTVSLLRGGNRSGTEFIWRDGLPAIAGHLDALSTECPGDELYAILPEVRRRVASNLGTGGPGARIAERTRDPWPGRLDFSWEPLGGATEFSHRLAGWRRDARPDVIAPLSGYDADEREVWSPWSAKASASFDIPGDAIGTFTLMVRARDSRGVEGRIVARRPLFVDRHVIVDDSDREQTRRLGAWNTRTEAHGFNGSGYAQADPGDGAAAFAWSANVPESGRYRLLACWTDGADRTARAVYIVRARGATIASTTIDQREGGGDWATLGEVDIDEPGVVEIVLTGDDDGTVAADAVRLVLVADAGDAAVKRLR